jgi:hypothetical protein
MVADLVFMMILIGNGLFQDTPPWHGRLNFDLPPQELSLIIDSNHQKPIKRRTRPLGLFKEVYNRAISIPSLIITS